MPSGILALVLLIAAPVWWVTCHVVGGRRDIDHWQSARMTYLGYAGGFGLMGGAMRALSSAIERRNDLDALPTPWWVLAVGLLGLVALGVSAFFAFFLVLSFVVRRDEQIREQRLARLERELSVMFREDPAVHRAYFQDHHGMRTDPYPSAVWLYVEADPGPTTNMSVVAQKTQEILRPTLPVEVVVLPRGSSSPQLDWLRREGRMVYDRGSSR